MRSVSGVLSVLAFVLLPGLAPADEPRLDLVVQTGHTSGSEEVAMSGDGKYLVTGSQGKAAILWEAATGRILQTFQEHSDRIRSVAISGDGKCVVTGMAADRPASRQAGARPAILWESAT